jgi:hypothetical protein
MTIPCVSFCSVRFPYRSWDHAAATVAVDHSTALTVRIEGWSAGYLFGKPEAVELAPEKLGEEERAAMKEMFEQF